MTENTVPRVARFADLRVGMTVERVYTHPSGTTTTFVGLVSKVTARFAIDDAGFWLAAATDDDDPCITLRILADPTPKPLPAWGTVVRVIGGEHGGKRAVRVGFGDHPLQWGVEDYGWDSVESVTDWEVIHDPNGTPGAIDWQKWVDEAKRSDCGVEIDGVYIQAAERYWAGPAADPLDEDPADMCGAMNPDSYICTLDADHTGPHVAMGASVAHATWGVESPTADPLDENDHRDRIDRHGLRITRHGNKHWHPAELACTEHCGCNALADWDAACGPLRFADEVTA